MGDVYVLDVGQFAELLESDIVFRAIQFGQIREILQMLRIDLHNPLIRDIRRHHLFWMLNMQHLKQQQPINKLLRHGFFPSDFYFLDLVRVF